MGLISVVGPPGSGKTAWLMNDIQEKLKSGVRPQEIAAVTFTRAAASEIRRRLIQRFPEYRNEDFRWVGTVHSICSRLLQLKPASVFADVVLREFCARYPAYTFSPDPVHEDEDDLPEIEVHEAMLKTPADWFEHFDSRRRNARISFDMQLKYFSENSRGLPLEWSVEMQKQYSDRKAAFLQERECFDFNGLLESVLLQRCYPPVKHIYCDESQDNSPLVWAVLKMWAHESGCLGFTCLMDPDQCIYDPFLPADQPQTQDFIDRSQKVQLAQSYRLPRRVHEISEAWIRQNKRRMDRFFLPREQEGLARGFRLREEMDWDDLAFHPEGYEGSRWKAFMISRTRWQSTLMKQWLTKRGIPFAVNRGKANPIQSGRGRLAYAFACIAEGGNAEARNFLPMKKWLPAKPWLSHGGKTQFLKYITAFPERHLGPQDLLMNGFSINFLEALERDFLEPLKMTDWDKTYIRRCYSRYGRKAFARSPALLVTNTHGVKGMQADFVVVDPDLYGLPAASFINDPEDERRVAYVAITRARRRLYVLMPKPSAPASYNFRIERTVEDLI